MNTIFDILKKIDSKYNYIFEECKFDVDLSDYVTFRTSGVVSCLYEPKNTKDLIQFLKYLKEKNIKFFILGKGSNLIVSEEGYDGVAIRIGKNFDEYKITKIDEENYELYCQSGAMLSFVSNQSFRKSLTGLEPISLIPGTMGGAIYMNAGAYGKEIKDVLKYAEVLNIDTLEVEKFQNDMCEFGYRKSHFMNDKYIILACVLELSLGDEEEILKQVAEFRDKRKASQPLDKPNAGSTFKRPIDDFAGRLIDVSNLKGMSIGGASVSEKHAGFIVNNGDARPNEIIKLIEEVKKIVYEKQGVLLEEELRIIK